MSRFPLGTALLGAAAVVSFACRGPIRPTRIVLITLDTLRYDSFGGGPGRASTMPLTLGRARRGLVFERFYSATSSTQPSHASLFTGLHPWQHGLTRNGLVLREEHVTLTERLRAAGFTTAAVVGSFPVLARFGFGQGFDRFDEELSEGRLTPGFADAGDPEERYYRLAGPVTAAALAQLDLGRGPRQFYWFHYFDPHAPYGDSGEGPQLRPRDILEQARAGRDVGAEVARARALYDLDVASLDRELNRLLERLERDAVYDTHVVVTADHGESFGEDGSLAHGRRVTAGQVHVPCFVLSPRVKAAVRTDVAGSIDVANTVLSLAGLRPSAPGGRDLTSGTAAGGAFGMRRVFGEAQRELRLDGKEHPLHSNLFFAVGSEGRLHAGNAQGFSAEEGELPPDAAAGPLRSLFGSFERQLEGAERPVPVDPEVERALKALGYAG